jgi:putative ABC transport system permease protein
MLNNYIKIALRNILRNKLHSFINIMSLSIGMTCALLLTLYIMDDLSYDRHNSKHARIYVVQTISRSGGNESSDPRAPYPLGPTLKDLYPAVEEFARTITHGKFFFIDKSEEIIGEDNISFADPQIFKVLDHKFIYGSPEGALDSPHTIVLNESLAKKYFGDQDPVGKILSSYDGHDFTVKGVFKDLPANTSNPYDGLISINDYPDYIGREYFEFWSRLFSGASYTTYILLKKNGELTGILEDYKRFKNKYLSFLSDRLDIDYEYIPLTSLYLNQSLILSNFTRLQGLYVLSLLAFFILVVACINYMNLATARSIGRAREVGVRKALGADRASLIRQFLSESIIITVAAILISLMLVELVLPFFNSLVFKELHLSMTGGIGLYLSVFFITLIVGVMSGSYPAIYLSSILPVKVLGKSPQSVTGKGLLRKILVVAQYSISIVMIICMLLALKQMNHINSMEPGYNADNIFSIFCIGDEQIKTAGVLKNIILNHSGVISVAKSSFYPGGVSFLDDSCKVEDPKGNIVEKQMALCLVDDNCIGLMGMKVIEGRSFDRENGGDRSGAVLINETFTEEMGWTDSPIGKRVIIDNSYNVIGVLKDFRPGSLYKKVNPLVIMLGDKYKGTRLGFLNIKISPIKSEETLKFIREKWLELTRFDRHPPPLASLEGIINSNYIIEKRLIKILISSAILCILISCLGSFGLSSFFAENRTKEIGIRKVNGASVGSIVINMTCHFLKLVLISGIIACPIAYFAMNRWFENIAYRTEMSPWVFILGVCIAMIIAWLTVSFHSIKAAMSDPVKALRYE